MATCKPNLYLNLSNQKNTRGEKVTEGKAVGTVSALVTFG